jgi:aspartyl-tRNA(Asn)/glutamyl-tRNA(Gln) amidotransferase subunit C
MSLITTDQVRHVALLSRLALGDNELEQYARELNTILEYMDKLQELNTENIVPMAHAIRLVNVLAADEEVQPLTTDEATANAPDADRGCFKVPKVIQQIT